MKSGHFQALDSWRGVCALIVAAFHFPAAGAIGSLSLVQHGALFVDFFFVLSGFVIAANYLDRLGDTRAVERFLWLRVGRLYPLHVTIFLAYFAFEALKAVLAWRATGGLGDAFTGDKTFSTALSNIFLVHSLGLHDDVSWNRPSWSISCELFAYLTFALITWTFSKMRMLAYAIALIGSLIVVARFSENHLLAMSDFGLYRCIAGFMAGVLTWRLWSGFQHWADHRAKGGALWTVAEAGAVVGVGGFVSTVLNGPANLAAPFVFAALVFVFAFEKGALSRWLRSRSLLLLGTLSYSIYMVHYFLIDRLLNVAVAVQNRAPISLIAYDDEGAIRFEGATPLTTDALHLGFLGLVVAVSYVTYRIIEAPSRDWFRRKKFAAPATLSPPPMTSSV